jgi:hypothetical protein
MPVTGPLGFVPAFAGVGYNNEPSPFVASQFPVPPVPLATGSYQLATTTTLASSESGASSTYSAGTTQMFYVNPMQVYNDVSFREIEMGMSASFVVGTGSGTAGWNVGIYQQTTTYKTQSGSGTAETTSGTVFTKIIDGGFGIMVSQNSATDFGVRMWVGTASNATTAAGSTTSGNISTDFTGQREVVLYNNTAGSYLPMGSYLVVHGHSSRSSNAAVFSCNHGMFLSQSQTASSGYYLGSAAYVAPYQLAGKISTTGSASATGAQANVPATVNLLPSSFLASQVSATASGEIRWLVPNIYY